jgi:predicted GNAT family acetyltransferase
MVMRGETPMLHVRADNQAAVRVYERLGFRTRQIGDVLIVQRIA